MHLLLRQPERFISRDEVCELIDRLTENLISIKDETGEFLLRLEDGRVIDGIGDPQKVVPRIQRPHRDPEQFERQTVALTLGILLNVAEVHHRLQQAVCRTLRRHCLVSERRQRRLAFLGQGFEH